MKRGCKKPHEALFFLLLHQPPNFKIVRLTSSLERAFSGFWANFFGCWTPFKNWCCIVHKNSLTASQLVSSLHQDARSDTSFWTEQSECLMLSEHSTHVHTSEGDSLVFKVVWSPPSRSCQVNWDYVHRSACLNRFRSKSRRRIANCWGWAAKLWSCRRRHARFILWSCFHGRKWRRRQDLSNKLRSRPDIFESWWVVCHIDEVCNFFSTVCSSESCFRVFGGWAFIEQTRILSGIQFTRHFIKRNRCCEKGKNGL